VANIYLNFTATNLSKIIMISGNYLFVDIGNSTILTYLLDLTPTNPPPINPNNTNNTNNTSNNLLNFSDDNLNSI
jgi:hypothetical protein